MSANSAVASSAMRTFTPEEATQEDWALVSEVLARFTAPDRVERLNEVLSKRRKGLHIVLENLENPYDIAAILRTAEGLGVQHVHCIDSSKKPRRNEVNAPTNEQSGNQPEQRTSRSARRTADGRRVTKRALGNVAMGAGRWLTVRTYRNTFECYKALKGDYSPHMQILASTPAPADDLSDRVSQLDRSTSLGRSGPPSKPWRAAITRAAMPIGACLEALGSGEGGAGAAVTSGGTESDGSSIALVFGEGGKLSRKALEHADQTVYLDGVCGLTKSFSLSTTMAMSVYAVLASQVVPEGTLSEAERAELLGRWLLRDVRAAKQILRVEANLDVVEAGKK